MRAAAAGQIVASSAGPRSRPWPDRTARRSAHCARRDRAALRDAVLARRIAGQAAHALLQREGAGLAHPVREEVQPEAGVAEVDEVRAGVRQRDHARRMLEQRRHARVVVLVELRHELRIERQVEHVVQGILASSARELGTGNAVLLDLRPVAVEQDARSSDCADSRASARETPDRGRSPPAPPAPPP